MADDFDLLVADAVLPFDGDRRVSIGVRDGTITDIGPPPIGSGSTRIEAEGGLVTPPFTDPHLHLDKVYTLDRAGETALERYQDEADDMGDAMGAIEAASAVKDEYDETQIYDNAKRALELGIKHGVLAHRAFADTDTSAGLTGIKPLLELREEFADVVDLQVVAFPQDGVVRDPGAADYVAEAMDHGADAVGGIPWIEYTDADQAEHIDRMFDLAVTHDADVAMLTDDAGDPGLRTTERLAVRAIEEGWNGRVTACHARAMELYPEPYLQKLVGLLDKADMDIVTDPQTGPLHVPVDDLLEAGITVSLGQDDIADAYYPFGQNSMLEVGFLAAHLLWKTRGTDVRDIYRMVTTAGAASLGLDGYGLAEGTPADMVVFDVGSVAEAIHYQPVPTQVVADGQVVAETTEETTLAV